MSWASQRSLKNRSPCDIAPPLLYIADRTFGGPWRLYTHPLAGWEMLGTIQRGMEIGALAKSPDGIYAQINAGAVRPLDQRKIAATLEACRGTQG